MNDILCNKTEFTEQYWQYDGKLFIQKHIAPLWHIFDKKSLSLLNNIHFLNWKYDFFTYFTILYTYAYKMLYRLFSIQNVKIIILSTSLKDKFISYRIETNKYIPCNASGHK